MTYDSVVHIPKGLSRQRRKMGYSGHSSTPPRSVLVIVGGILAWLGLVSGVLLTTPQYHLAMTSREEPELMTWQQLVEHGLTDNSHVRLIDVAVQRPAAPDFAQGLPFDPDDFDPESLEDQEEALRMFAEGMDFASVIEAAFQPFKIYPRGQDPDDYPAVVIIPPATLAAEAAAVEVEQTGTLTGRFTRGTGDDLHLQMAQTIANAAMGEGIDPLEIGGEPSAEQYVFEPMSAVPNRTEAAQWFWLSGLAAAVGLVICGAGGPSIACFFFFQVPSVLSVFGYPLRYGRGNHTTRALYLLVGLGLIYYGYNTMVVTGKFGQLDGDMFVSALGFVPTFFGLAAVLGAGTNWLADRLNLSLDPKRTSSAAAPKISLEDACSVEPSKHASSAVFADRDLEESSAELPAELQLVAEGLAEIGFETPLRIAQRVGDGLSPVLIQIGCQNMVVTDVETNEGVLQTRLVSVLHDGITVVTVSNNGQVASDSRLGSSGQYLRSSSDDPLKMLSAHLEQTIAMAEKRDTTVVVFEVNEAIDVAAFGRRILADIRAQYGEQNQVVSPASYGRFRYPARPVPQLEAKAS